MQRWGLNNCAA